MTIEIEQFKCPYCGNLLGKEEAKAAQLIKQKEIDETVEQKLHQKVMHLETEQAKKVCELEKQLEESRNHATNYANERVRQAVAEKEEGYRQTEEQYKLRIGRLDDDNKRLQFQIEEQRKRLNNIPGELGGTAGENVLFEDLKEEFKTDIIMCKKNGVAMADIIQIIVTEKGEKISSPIVYDKKTSSKVTKMDLEKAKNYKRIHNTDHCIIVTNDIVKENRFSETRDGILLVRPSAIIDIAYRIRLELIEASKWNKVNGGRESKKDKLYKFFTSSEYSREVRRKTEVKAKLDEIQLEEEEKHRKWWNRRRDYIAEWMELDKKENEFINDVTEENGSKDTGEEGKDDGDFPSL